MHHHYLSHQWPYTQGVLDDFEACYRFGNPNFSSGPLPGVLA